MEHALIELGRTYLCIYGDARYRVTAREKSGSLVLVRLEAKLEGGRTVVSPEAAEIGAEMWVAPESIEPEEPPRRDHAGDAQAPEAGGQAVFKT